jgi:glycosyltransferase involved in cell wall biosynthesis
MVPTFTVVIPARNSERTIAEVLTALTLEKPTPLEVIVVDDHSSDRTAEIAQEHGARLVQADRQLYAGGARNLGWNLAKGDTVVFLDSDVVVEPGWAAGLSRALAEFPGAIIGCARTFTGSTPWEWVAHLQIETPYLPRGTQREVPFVSSYCMAVPRDAPLRWDESYGGEDAVFCHDAVAAGLKLVFDPRFQARHVHSRQTYRQLRLQQERFAFSLARCGTVQREGLHKRIFSRFPLHYFALARLVLIYRRVRPDPDLRGRFLSLLPYLVIAEWTLGVSALRYALRPRPALRVPPQPVPR